MVTKLVKWMLVGH